MRRSLGAGRIEQGRQQGEDQEGPFADELSRHIRGPLEVEHDRVVDVLLVDGFDPGPHNARNLLRILSNDGHAVESDSLDGRDDRPESVLQGLELVRLVQGEESEALASRSPFRPRRGLG